MIRRLLFWFLLLSLVACKKEKHIIIIKGKLLQSSSNPVPVDNYKLAFYQNGSSGAPIAIGSSSAFADCITNTNGIFQCNFILGTSTFLGINSSNKGSISMSGQTTGGLLSLWSNIPASDTNLNTIYLYKLVHKAIIKVYPASDIKNTDTIYINTQTLAGSYSRVITGLTIAADTATVIDTIPDLLFNFYSFATNQYQGSFSISRKKNIGSYSILEPPMDEDEKIYIYNIF